MPDSPDDTTKPSVLPAESLGQQPWEQEVVPRLPKGWQQQAKDLKAFQRSRELRSASDLLRGILAYVLCVHSFRQPLHLGRAHRAG